nr:MAG TPA: hypothetical protein [Caudoviricetes sp.]
MCWRASYTRYTTGLMSLTTLSQQRGGRCCAL